MTLSSRKPLEPRYYIDEEQFHHDKSKIFYRNWQCVCHVSEVNRRGDFATLTILDEDVFVVRGNDGIVRAFYNVCRHRGHPLVEGFGRGKNRLVCPYHAWSYDLAGTLQRAPGAADGDGIDCAKIRLRAIRVEELCGFVFVNLDDAAAPLGPELADLDAEFRTYHSVPEKLRFVCETSIEHQCNWKLSVENYNECYHCPTVHASSLTKGVLSLDGYTTKPHGTMIWHEGKAQTKNMKQYDYDTTSSARAGDYGAYWIWPNVAFCFYPGGFFTVRQWLPVSYRKTIYRYRWFSDGMLTDESVQALMQKHKLTTGAEDEVVVSKIQKGMESRAFEPGPYVIGDGSSAMSEVGLRHFHDLYRIAIGEQAASGVSNLEQNR